MVALLFVVNVLPSIAQNYGHDSLRPDQSLGTNQSITSQNGRYSLIMQGDGNLVLYRNSDGIALWASNTYLSPAVQADMQSDGNLVVYSADGTAIWATDTWTEGRSFLYLQNDGNLVIYRERGGSTWASNTVQGDPQAPWQPRQTNTRRIRETLTDRCSRDVIIVSNYDDGLFGIPSLFLSREMVDSTGYTPWFSLSISSRRIRWFCHSTTGNIFDPGTWDGFFVGVKCNDDGSGCRPSGGGHSLGPILNPREWTAERSRCPSGTTYIEARLGPNRLLQMRCY
jgi:hypothetical protein